MVYPLIRMSDEEASNNPSVFESKDVLQITGIPAVYLNRFIEHKSFGIRPSIRTGTGRGSRRLFGTPDVFGIALGWWLFQSGLRSQVISRVLRGILPPEESLAARNAPAANAAAIFLGKQLRSREPLVLVISRSLTGPKSRKKSPEQRVAVARASEIRASDASSVQIIPVGKLLRNLYEQVQHFHE
jgi:hypothetical protein